MPIEVPRPSDIPIAPGIKLENLINFDGDCIDPMALVVITEALDYALESSNRRLRSLGKIFSGIESTAIGTAERPGVLAMINAVRAALEDAPICDLKGKPMPKRITPVPSTAEEAIVARAEERAREQLKPKVTIEPVTPTVPREKKKPPEKPKARTVPEIWGEVEYKGKKFESPTVLAKHLGLKIEGAKNMVDVFRRAGYEVSGDGEPTKGGKFAVTKVSTTPLKYKQEWPEVPVAPAERKEEREFKRPFIAVKKEGKIVRYEDAEGRPLPAEMWPSR